MDMAEMLFGKQVVLKPFPVDRSDLEAYSKCPQQGYLLRQHRQEHLGKLVDVGTLIHELIQEAIKYCEGHYEQGDLSDYFTNELPKSRPDLSAAALAAATYVAQSLDRLPIHHLEGLEKQIDFEFLPASVTPEGYGPLKLTTCIDLYYGGRRNNLVVWDWKTGFKKRTNEEAQNSFQAQFIAYLLWQFHPEIETIDFWFKETRWGTNAYARFDRSKTYLKIDDLTQEMTIQGRIMEVVKLWLSDCQDAWPDPVKCVQCDVKQYCKHAHQNAIDIAKDPKAFIDRLTVMEALVDDQKKIATDYLKEYGTIEGTSAVFEYRPSKPRFSPKLYVKKDKDGEYKIKN